MHSYRGESSGWAESILLKGPHLNLTKHCIKTEGLQLKLHIILHCNENLTVAMLENSPDVGANITIRTKIGTQNNDSLMYWESDFISMLKHFFQQVQLQSPIVSSTVYRLLVPVYSALRQASRLESKIENMSMFEAYDCFFHCKTWLRLFSHFYCWVLTKISAWVPQICYR